MDLYYFLKRVFNFLKDMQILQTAHLLDGIRLSNLVLSRLSLKKANHKKNCLLLLSAEMFLMHFGNFPTNSVDPGAI